MEPLVKSCMEGYNATVFAYGQTVSVINYKHGNLNHSFQHDLNSIVLTMPFSNISYYNIYMSVLVGLKAFILLCLSLMLVRLTRVIT